MMRFIKSVIRPLSGVIVILFLSVSSRGQSKNVAHEQQVWLGYFNQTRLSDKWGIWADVHLRTKEDLFTNFSTAIGRVGLTYYIDDHVKLTAGYAYVNHFPADNHRNISQPEHRPWQQLQWHNNFSKLRLMQYLRFEQRFRRKILNDNELADGYNFNYRVRYNVLALFALTNKKFTPGGWSFVLHDEVHINFGKQIVYNTFDQNRFFIGFQYQAAKSTAVQFGYMNQFIQTSAGSNYRSIHVPRFFIFQNLDLRKKAG
jgi:hypothetical protein